MNQRHSSRLAVIIPHYDDVVRLERCLSSVMPQTLTDTEVIVVDNNSTQSLQPIRAVYPDLRIVIENEKGAAAARNRGVAETSAPILLFLDSDCIAAPDWLETASGLTPNDKVIGGAITLFDETAAPRSGPEAFETVFAFDNENYIHTKGFSVTANLLTTRNVFESVGPFRPGVSEDFDWCRRATTAGFPLEYCGDLKVAHPTRSNWSALRLKWLRLTEEAWGLRGNSFQDRALWSLRALAMPASILFHVPRVLMSSRLAGPQERLRAIGTLTRLRMARCGWMMLQAFGCALRR